MKSLHTSRPYLRHQKLGSVRDVLLLLAAGAILIVGGCGSPRATRNRVLPDLTLVDQNGQPVVLSSLSGKPLLVDFIYTSCPGPCRTITQSMERVAAKLGPALGSQVTFVSISIDPEHEGPPQLLRYAKALNADRRGWLFLSGGPADIDSALATFHLKRERSSSGEIVHLERVILISADGRTFKVYTGAVLHPDSVLADLRRAGERG